MSEKKQKDIRALARHQYSYELYVWKRAEPPRWRFIARRRWKKKKPVYEDIEKGIRRVYK